MHPTRVERLHAAHARFGDQAHRVAAFLNVCDPLADACVDAFAELPAGRGFELVSRAIADGIDRVPDAPPALRALFASLDRVPAWVDWDVVDRGGELLLRSGPLGAMVLGFRSLVIAYAAPGGNKPLVLSGRLTDNAGRRLAETGRYVHEVARPRSLRRDGEGFAITVKVRLMHAQVRRLVRRSGKWQSDAWGEPVNQHDMLGTALVFSVAMIDGLRQLGFRLSDDEVHGYIQLWRYASHLMGLDHELLFSTEREGRRLGDIIAALQGPPDEDARALVAALFSSGLGDPKSRAEAIFLRGYRRFVQGLSRGFVGDELADGVALPDDLSRYALPAIRPIVRVAERVRERSEIARRVAIFAGNERWKRVVRAGLGDAPAEFRPPERLAR